MKDENGNYSIFIRPIAQVTRYLCICTNFGILYLCILISLYVCKEYEYFKTASSGESAELSNLSYAVCTLRIMKINRA
jgi:hypothetical protein